MEKNSETAFLDLTSLEKVVEGVVEHFGRVLPQSVKVINANVSRNKHVSFNATTLKCVPLPL